MKQSKNKFYIHYSFIPSLPIVGPIIYKIQIFLLQNRFINKIIISNKKIRERDDLISFIKSDDLVVIKSTKFSRYIANIKARKVLDVKLVDLNSLNTPDLYNVMWTLVFCDALTSKTKKMLNKLIPSDFPEYAA